jgi:hypothetical protein
MHPALPPCELPGLAPEKPTFPFARDSTDARRHLPLFWTLPKDMEAPEVPKER